MEHVLARVDQPLRVPDRVLVRVLADPRVGDCSGGSEDARIGVVVRSPVGPFRAESRGGDIDIVRPALHDRRSDPGGR
jgi:hypothetical protein